MFSQGFGKPFIGPLRKPSFVAARGFKSLDCYDRGVDIEAMAAVELTPEAAEQFDRVPLVIRARMDRLRERLRRWPNVSGVKALSGNLAGWHRMRTGDYRLRFRVADRGDRIIVDKIGHRSEFYEE